MKSALLIVVTIIIFSLSSSAVIVDAKKSEEPFVYEQINPDSRLLYKYKRLKEKLYTAYLAKFRKEKLSQNYIELINRRFRELKYVVDKDKIDLLETVTSRYNSQIGEVTNINTNQETNINALQAILEIQQEILPTLRDKYPANSAQWLLLQQTLDTINAIVN
ncbi:MAG: DUF5667 domain-containing protein [Patescibacteria group bacterium]|nr:DUF5667 domain-containing protein [Patescibacteria group bacterium]